MIHKRQTLIAMLVVAVLAGVAVAWLNRGTDPKTWPRCVYFRCRECAGPASVDPSQPERWACLKCERTTCQLVRYFRITRPHEQTAAELANASVRVGIIAPEGSDGSDTLIGIYRRSRGRHW